MEAVDSGDTNITHRKQVEHLSVTLPNVKCQWIKNRKRTRDWKIVPACTDSRESEKKTVFCGASMPLRHLVYNRCQKADFLHNIKHLKSPDQLKRIVKSNN